MYAVIAAGGKQFRVAPGDQIRVDRLDKKAGEPWEIPDVLMIKDSAGVRCGTPTLADAMVRCTVMGSGRSRKVIVFKKKRRKQFRRTRGHRQAFTVLRVDEIASSSSAS